MVTCYSRLTIKSIIPTIKILDIHQKPYSSDDTFQYFQLKNPEIRVPFPQLSNYQKK